jgi:hypothetical protein
MYVRFEVTVNVTILKVTLSARSDPLTALLWRPYMPTKVKCMGLTISSYSTLLVQVHRDFGSSVQSASPAIGRCRVLACESMLCSVPFFSLLSVGLYYDSVYSTVYGYLIRVYISIHSVVCLTTVP